MVERRGRFVGVGIDAYESHEPLEHAIAEVRAVAEALGAEFIGEPLLDPDEGQVREHLKAVPGCVDSGALVLLWCGHGVQSGSKLWLQTRDAGGRISAADVIDRCAESGGAQLLFVVDACQAGAGVAEASVVTSALLEELPRDAEHVWFGILVSCSASDIGARDGAFGEALLQLLKDGPRSPDMRRRWSRHNRLIRGDDLGQALLEDWTSEDQRPDFLRRGSAWYMLPNPLWDPGAPEEVVEHLLLAARGGTSADHRSWFTGRTTEVDEVVAWVAVGAAGIRVVTGSAGTGKSAVVGRVVSLSNPEERRRLAQHGALVIHADPGERSVAAHVHARGLTADRMAESLDGQLVRSGVLVAGQRDRRNAAELVGALQRAAEDGGPRPVLVIDGLDEARSEAFTIAADLLVHLARYASLVVSTRPVTRAQLPMSLIDVLQVDAVLNLDDPLCRESGRAAMRGYVVSRLSGVTAEMDPEVVADHLVDASSHTDDRPFLLARVVSDQLRAAPIDTSTPNWERQLAHSIESAFDVDLVRVTPPGVGLPPGTAPAGVARSMLAALTWAFGAGFPEEEWLAVASRLAEVELGRDHISWALDGLGRYVVQDGEGGTAVYRVAHQSLADHLRPPYRRTGERPFDPAAEPVWAALAARYNALLVSGYPAAEPTYLWRYAYRHSAASGLEGLTALRELAAVAAELRPDIGHAALEIAGVLAAWGRRAEAVAPTEEVVALRRELAADNPAYLPDLAGALTSLGARYNGVGRRAEAVAPTEEAAHRYRELAADNPAYAPNLAGALTNLGLCYSGVGRRAEALAPTEEAVALRRELAADNPAYLPNLAMALTNLGIRYSEVGRRAEAVAPTEEAAHRYRELAADNPAYAPDLATALTNLGAHYSGVGRRAEAVAPTEEAVNRYRELAADNPAYAPDLAGALTNLGLFYSGVGRRAEALAPTEEAVNRYRELAADNPAYAPDLAGALTNLGLFYSGVGRRAEALAPTEEAVALRRELAADNPAYAPDLAGALTNLGLCYSGVGRRAEAVAPTEEAAHRYREQADDNPAYAPDLATALTNLGIFYSGVGRRAEALAPTEEAVDHYRALAADNPAYLPDLAGALNNVGMRYSEVGRRADALPPTEEAAGRYREQADDNPAYLPNLATALTNLGIRYSEVGRRTDALAPTEEAVDHYRELAADNPAFLPNLAAALNNLGVYYSELGRRADALAPTEEAAGLYRELATDNPAFLPDLASALNNVEMRFAATGDSARAEAIWQDALGEHDPPARATLLLYRSLTTDPGDARAAPWLVEACRSGDRDLLGAAHENARSHRAESPEEWDAAWAEASGAEPPAWLTVDRNVLAVATAWIDTPTYNDERDHLVAHPELLTSGADIAVDEALLRIDESAAERYRQIRVHARADGVEAAYRPLFLVLLANGFAAANPVEQRDLLSTRRAELLDDLVRDYLDERAGADETGEVSRAAALLTIAAEDRADAILTATLDALDDPARFPELLDATARDTESAATVLAPLATIAATAATTNAEAAVAALYLAVASEIAGDEDRAAEIVRQALTWDPGSAPSWITRLAGLGAVQPGVLPLIAVLVEDGDGGEH